MALEGMDVELVQKLAYDLKNQIETQMRSLISGVDGIVGQLEGVWRGADASDFEHSWQSLHRPALLRCADLVGDLGQLAFTAAQHQNQASQA